MLIYYSNKEQIEVSIRYCNSTDYAVIYSISIYSTYLLPYFDIYMKRTYYNHYEESEVQDMLNVLNLAQNAIGKCCEDQGLKCMTCDKRSANYFIDQAKKILKGRQEYTNAQ